MSTDLGAIWIGENRCRFRVWAPHSDRVQVRLVTPGERIITMESKKRGYHEVVAKRIEPGARYVYRLANGKEFPDPASRYQPEGVHGPSEVVNPHFDWTDGAWFGIPLEDYVIYELHVGTFTPEGTFEAIIPHLDELAELGVTAIELMPVAQFSGARNWGYDGVYPFAAQNCYGGPYGLKKLVNACHERGLAVVLDVVYNHLGPEGNYLPNFGPYLTDRYRTPWGPALNFDDSQSDEVRHFFISNAIEWVTEYRIDALRLDAVHTIIDHSAVNILEELTEAVHHSGSLLNRRVHIIAESSQNDTKLIQPPEAGGYGLDAQWNDDFHHSLHTLLTRERVGYYSDFGDFQHMEQAFSEGFVYSEHYSVDRQRHPGNHSRSIPPVKFVVYAQNHDQIGNRMAGERLSQLVSLDAYKLAASVVLLSPFIPLLFMGDEYGESAPFQYFVNHSDLHLVEAVRQGREDEFASFKWKGEPPDPQDWQTFLRAKLNHSLTEEPLNQALLAFHKELLRLRKSMAALRSLSKETMDVSSYEDRVLVVRRWSGTNEILLIVNFNDRPLDRSRGIPEGVWRKCLDASESRWMGCGIEAPDVIETPESDLTLQPYGVLAYEKETRPE